MAVDFPKGLPVFHCDGEDCSNVLRSNRFGVKESAAIAREAGWEITEVTPREWSAYCGRHALLREQVAG